MSQAQLPFKDSWHTLGSICAQGEGNLVDHEFFMGISEREITTLLSRFPSISYLPFFISGASGDCTKLEGGDRRNFEEREREREREQTKFLAKLRNSLNTCLAICGGFQVTHFQMLQTEILADSSTPPAWCLPVDWASQFAIMSKHHGLSAWKGISNWHSRIDKRDWETKLDFTISSFLRWRFSLSTFIKQTRFRLVIPFLSNDRVLQTHWIVCNFTYLWATMRPCYEELDLVT